MIVVLLENLFVIICAYFQISYGSSIGIHITRCESFVICLFVVSGSVLTADWLGLGIYWVGLL